jgi:23S rRNA (cytosine1962-C5)-methyltransferase
MPRNNHFLDSRGHPLSPSGSLTMPHTYPALRLRPKEDRRLRAGHLWIYSNEIDVVKTPLNAITPGSVCRIEDAQGKALGLAHVNPHTLLCARLLSRDPHVVIDETFYHTKLHQALLMRERLFSAPFYRLIHGEGDGLPGLIIDRYEDTLVVQAGSLGMNQDLPLISAALQNLLNPSGILHKASGIARRLEGLEDRVEVLFGHVPERLPVWENGCLFEMDPRAGQKTGWFYDHRANRRRLLSYAPGRRVLDCFAYLGAFSIPLAKAGATEVTAVDSSASALALLEENAQRNQVTNLQTIHGDAMETLANLRDRGAQFDLIVLDPPALIKSKKDFKEGSIAYRRFNDMAMRLLAPGGILFTASCSHHLNRETLLGQIAFAAQRGDYAIIGEGTQDMDHPIHPAVPESSYLKGFFIHRREAIPEDLA